MPTSSLTLPDFIIIGANKAGTTSLVAYLQQHPEIEFSEIKEPMFFSNPPSVNCPKENEATLADPYFATNIESYSRLFKGHKMSARFYGEASTAYLANPDPAASLIKKICPNAKLIAILRDPVSRAISAYRMARGNGLETRTFDEIVNIEVMPILINKSHALQDYIRNGLYAQLLAPYFEYFRREQMLFINYGEFYKNPDHVLSKICRFIGTTPIEFDVSVRHNRAEDHDTQEMDISPSVIKKLRRIYRDDIVRTAEMTGLDTELWL